MSKIMVVMVVVVGLVLAMVALKSGDWRESVPVPSRDFCHAPCPFVMPWGRPCPSHCLFFLGHVGSHRCGLSLVS